MLTIEKRNEYHNNFLSKHPNYFTEYREKNRDKMICNSRQYYQDNKDKFFVNVTCEKCGKMMLKANLKRHQKTKLCAKFALRQEQEQEQEQIHLVNETVPEEQE